MDCTLFGARADGLSKILVKGIKVAIDGKLRWSQWERDGQKRSKVEIIVDSLDFMSQRSNAASMSASMASEPTPSVAPMSATDTYGAGAVEAPSSVAPTPDVSVPADSYGEDIPF